MNRLVALGLALMLMSGMHGGLPAASPAAAGNQAEASADGSTFTFVDRFFDSQIDITASISANAPIACNARLLHAQRPGSQSKVVVMANCRIAAKHRNGQRATIRGSITAVDRGDLPDLDYRCRDAQFSDPESGRVKLRCEFQLEPIDPAD